MQALAQTSFAGAKLQAKQAKQTRGARVVVAAHADQARRAALAAAVFAVPVLLGAQAANAGLVEELLAKTEVNKELHAKQRLASSNANFARSRTVTDGTCSFPSNFLGCDLGKYAGDVKYIADEKKVECEGTLPGLCAGDMNATKYARR